MSGCSASRCSILDRATDVVSAPAKTKTLQECPSQVSGLPGFTKARTRGHTSFVQVVPLHSVDLPWTLTYQLALEISTSKPSAGKRRCAVRTENTKDVLAFSNLLDSCIIT